MSESGVKLWIKVPIGGNYRTARLGDAVWFYPGCNIEVTPQVGIITLISEDHMVDLMILTHQPGGKTRQSCVCLFGSPKLEIAANRSKGCWMPPTPLQIIEQSPNFEG